MSAKNKTTAPPDAPAKRTTPNGIVIEHDDHGLQAAHLEFIDYILSDWNGGFTIRNEPMPSKCGYLECGLYGPNAGDEPIDESRDYDENSVMYRRSPPERDRYCEHKLHTFFTVRGNRDGLSRMITAKPRRAGYMTIIADTVDGQRVCVAYGNSANMIAPREWWDYGPIDIEFHYPVPVTTYLPPTDAKAVFRKWALAEEWYHRDRGEWTDGCEQSTKFHTWTGMVEGACDFWSVHALASQKSYAQRARERAEQKRAAEPEQEDQ